MNFSLLHKWKNPLGENCSHGLTPANTASQKSNPLCEFLRDNEGGGRVETRYFRLKQYGLEHLFQSSWFGLWEFIWDHSFALTFAFKKFHSLKKEAMRTQGEKQGREKLAFSWDSMCHSKAFLVLLDQLSSSAWFFLSLNRLVTDSKGLCMKFHLLFFPPTDIYLLIHQVPSLSMTQIIL